MKVLFFPGRLSLWLMEIPVLLFSGAISHHPAANIGFSLYLISAYPSDMNSDYTMPVLLFELDGSDPTLRKRGELFSKESGARFVRPYYDSRVVVIGDAAAWYVPSRIKEGTYRYRVLPMSRPWTLLSEFGPTQAKGSLAEYLLQPPNEGLLWAVRLFERNEFRLMAWRIQTGEPVAGLPWSSLQYWRCHGVPALGVQGFDNTDLAQGRDGKLMIQEGGGPDRWPSTNWNAPEAAGWKESTRIFPFVINDKMVVVSAVQDRISRSDNRGESPFYFLDLAHNRWSKRVMKGGGSALRGFGEWLGGYVSEQKGPGEPLNIAGQAAWAELDQDRERAGLRKIELKFVWWEHHAPGILFAYHLPSQRYFEFVTNQGDSEVLLIEEDETIHFRVLDKLYRGRLSAGTFDDVRLIIQDPRVVDIHWMFRGDAWPEEFADRVWTEEGPP